MEFGPLVEASWLRDHFQDPDLRVIDFRWYLLGRSGRDEYSSGHIPGAVFVDLEAVTGKEGGGRHPLPSPQQFEAEMQNAGVSAETRVVVYDDATVAPTASRLWFLLGFFGHRAQAVLDGGLQAWSGPVEIETPHVRPGDFRAAPPDTSRVLDHEAGHIPGALNMPYTDNLTAQGKFKSREELRRRYERIGAGKGAVFYCGSGVNATQHLLAMEIAGLPNSRLYAGSWSDWSNRDLPVATGEEPKNPSIRP
jgi:thiosulfate/3-mercaptopyruvate sulfurtransferase